MNPSPPSPPPLPPPLPPPSFYPPRYEPHPPLTRYIHRVSNHGTLYPVDINHPFFTDPPENCYIYRNADDYSYTLYRINLHNSYFTTTITANPYIADSWVHDVRNHIPATSETQSGFLVAGIDCLFASSLEEARGILQLCVGDRCLVFQIFQAPSVPQSLLDFLSDRAIRFITFQYTNDKIKKFLANTAHKVVMRGEVVVLREFLQAEDRRRSLEMIALKYLKYDVTATPEVINSDWAVPILSNKQAIQASIIARCAFLVGLQIYNPNPGFPRVQSS